MIFQDKHDTPLTKRGLLDFFRSSETKQQLVGMEGEKIGVDANTGKTASYTGKNGYLAVLGKLYEELGWEITKTQGKFIMEMKRGKTYLMLESDGRIELTGSPHESMHDLAREFRIHQKEITEISDVFGISWLGIGFQPISSNKDIELIPKERTIISTKYMANKGSSSVAWAKKTASIQVNIDYHSQENFSQIGRVLFRIGPIINALFANSPFSQGKFRGYMSHRNHISLLSDPDRFIMPESLYSSEMSYQEWIDYCLDVPIMFLFKNKRWVQPRMTFRKYLEKGYRKHQATFGDWELHLSSIYLSARMKKVIEFRNCDSLPPQLVPAVPTLMKGLLYSQNALDVLENMTKKWTYYDFLQLQKDVAKNALKASINGTKILDLAKELVALAEESLKEERIVDFHGNDETLYLNPIKEFLYVKEMSPAEWLVEMWHGEWNKNMYPVLQWCHY